jgi:hypothetical protein
VGARVLAEDRDAVALVDERPSLATRFMPSNIALTIITS